MRIVSTAKAFQRLMAPIQLRSSFLMANVTRQLLEFILAAFIAKTEILGKRIIAVLNIDSVLDVSLIVKLMSPTRSTFEAVFTFPLLWNVLDLRR